MIKKNHGIKDWRRIFVEQTNKKAFIPSGGIEQMEWISLPMQEESFSFMLFLLILPTFGLCMGAMVSK